VRALVKAESREGLWLREVPEPTMGPDDALIRVVKTGICGTDLHIWSWDRWAQKTVPVPLVIGHEYAGEIVAVGANVHHLRPGQRVSGEGHVIGMHSRAARAGRFHHDPDTKGIGVTLPGAFAELLALPAFNIVPLPDEVDDETGAILDALGNAVHAALSFDLCGEDVLITGAGPIGIMAAAVARHAGACRVVITDIVDGRLALASRVVDAHPVNVAREELRAVMDRLRIDEGFAVGLEMSGAEAAFAQLIDAVSIGGAIASLGIPAGPMTVDWTKVVFKSLTIKGIYGREMFETWHKALTMLQSGLSVRGVITHRLPAERYAEGFAAMRSGEAGKVVLSWSGPAIQPEAPEPARPLACPAGDRAAEVRAR
jgi:threonine 3-dehydrogenase